MQPFGTSKVGVEGTPVMHGSGLNVATLENGCLLFLNIYVSVPGNSASSDRTRNSFFWW